MRSHRVATFVAIAILSISLFASGLSAAGMDGVMMKDGKMMMMKDGKPSGAMDHDMSMSDGTKAVSRNNIYIPGVIVIDPTTGCAHCEMSKGSCGGYGRI
jgi:hypothetical protein